LNGGTAFELSRLKEEVIHLSNRLKGLTDREAIPKAQ